MNSKEIGLKNKHHYFLIIIFILAIGVRCLMPIYLITSGNSWSRYMLGSSYVYDMLAMSISIARGEGIHLEYRSYVYNDLKLKSPKLYQISRNPINRPLYLDKGGIGQIYLIAGLNYLFGNVNVIIIQIVQGIIDSFGSLIVYGIIILFFSIRVSLVGALIYALWPPSIFFSYHFMGEAFIPILMLSIAYTAILALKKEKWYWYCVTGVLIGFSFSFRSDNFLILPFYLGFIIWIYRRKLIFAISKAALVLLFCILTILPFKILSS